MSWDEAVAEANAAAPPDAPILKIRARAADSILGSASFETADAASTRRWPFLFEPLLRYGPRAALAAGLVGFAELNSEAQPTRSESRQFRTSGVLAERRTKPSLVKGSPFSIVSAQFPDLRANRCQQTRLRQQLVPAFENLWRLPASAWPLLTH
jgi:hypothetical protein